MGLLQVMGIEYIGGGCLDGGGVAGRVGAIWRGGWGVKAMVASCLPTSDGCGGHLGGGVSCKVGGDGGVAEECRPRQLKNSVQVMDGAQMVVMQAVLLWEVVDFGSRLWQRRWTSFGNCRLTIKEFSIVSNLVTVNSSSFHVLFVLSI